MDEQNVEWRRISGCEEGCDFHPHCRECGQDLGHWDDLEDYEPPHTALWETTCPVCGQADYGPGE